MDKIIEHNGKVVSIHNHFVDVEVVVENEEGCVGCKAKDACMTGAGNEKIISAYTVVPGAFEVGEEVKVSMQQAIGMKAVTITYIIPFFIVLVVLLIMVQSGYGELASGLTGIGIMVLYYFGLYLFKDKIEKAIVFEITKISE